MKVLLDERVLMMSVEMKMIFFVFIVFLKKQTNETFLVFFLFCSS